MKLLLSISALALIFSTVAQTDIIATRSHGGTITNANSLDKGNFGIDEPSFELLKVEYIGNHCVVEKKKWYYDDENITRDTVCHSHLFESLDYNVTKIKEYFPKSVKFTGFERYKKEMKAQQQTNGSSIPWFLILSTAGFFGYLFIPTFIYKKDYS